MIGALTGKIFSKKASYVIVMVNGVGYRVFVPLAFLGKLNIGDETKLYIYTHVRDDTLELFGFVKDKQLRLFELIIAISGIGPKKALTIVDRGVENVEKAVVSSDVSFFTSIPRLGKKNAQKIIIELKPKIGDMSDFDLSGSDDGNTKQILDALGSLGFKKHEVMRVLPKMSKKTTKIEKRIKEALKLLSV